MALNRYVKKKFSLLLERVGVRLYLNPARPKNQASSPVFLFPDCMFKAC
jgi:hypothetical protein